MPNLFVFGPSGTGKSAVLRHLFQGPFSAPTVFLSFKRILTEGQLFERICSSLNAFCAESSYDASSFATSRGCDQFFDFLYYMSQLPTSLFKEQPIYIIFDDADRMLKEFPDLVGPFMRLRQFLPHLNICCIFSSSLHWDKYLSYAHSVVPVLVPFPAYRKDELMEILMLEMRQPFREPNLAQEYVKFYGGFLELVLKVFFPFCNQLNELRKIVRFLFPKYAAPVVSGALELSDSGGLYKAIQPSLRLGQLQFRDFVALSPSMPAKMLEARQHQGLLNPIFVFVI